MKHRILSLILTLTIISGIVATTPYVVNASTNGRTRQQAVDWAKSQVGKSIDADGAYGYQCVDVARAYYVYLGQSQVSGHGKDYATNSLPSGWTRIKNYSGFVPQPGDVAVLTDTSQYGHVAIVTSANSSTTYVVEQNVAGSYCSNGSWSTSRLWGVVRPDFPTDKKPTLARISINKENFSIGELFTMNFSSDVPAQYYLAILDANTGERVVQGTVTDTYINAFQKAGKYQAYFSAGNSLGSVDSNWITFYVYGSPPTTAKLSTNKTELSVGESITLNTYTDAYYVRIYTRILKGSTEVYNSEIPYNFTYTPPSAGVYQAYVSTSTHQGGVDSNWVTFYVGKYAVSLNNQSATTAGSTSVTAIYGKAMPSITVPKKTGYTFGGYYTGTNGSGTQYYKADGTSARNWDKTSATTLYAKWTANKYTVTLNNQSATTAGTTSVSATYGSAMPSITVPKKTGYTFAGYYTGTNGSGTQYYKADGTSARVWDKTSATTLYAKWTANKYTVTLNNQSATTAGTTSVSATYGSAMPSITVPKKTGYTFAGYYTGTNGSGTQYYKADGTSAKNWDKTSATTLYAKWTTNTYTVTFKNYDGTVLETKSVDYGSTVTYSGATPTKKADAQYTYTFSGWDKALTNITANTVITAKFTSTVNKYTVTFKNHDGTVLETKSVDYGSTVTYSGATPTKKADAQYTYTFSGWDKALTNITGNIVITAKFTSTVNKYTVTFKNYDGTVLETKSVDYGSAVTYSGATPTKQGDAQYTYTFSGWDKALTNITGNTVITALFASISNKYTVTLNNQSATTAGTSSVSATYGSAMPTITPPKKTGYTFDGYYDGTNGSGTQYYKADGTSARSWDKTTATMLYAKWIANTYTVTFNSMGGTKEIEPIIIAYGSVCGELPIPEKDGFIFKGWYTKEVDGEEVTDKTIVTSNMSLYAYWETATPYIEAMVTKSGTKLTIDAKVYNFATPYDILIVGYKENKFVTMKRVPHNEQNSPCTLECDIDKIKVMVWNNLSTLKPLCETEEITSDKFIIE